MEFFFHLFKRTMLLLEAPGMKQKCLLWNLKLNISAIQRKRLQS